MNPQKPPQRNPRFAMIDWNEISKRGLLVRINREIMFPIGLAVFRQPETGISGGALVAPDGVWHYGDEASSGEAPACPSNCSCNQTVSPAVAAAAARWEAFRKAVVEEDDVFLDLMMDALANEHKLTAEQWDAAIDVAIALHTKGQEALPGRVFANDGSQPEDDAHLQCPACAGSGHIEDLTAAARDVLAERRRQRLAEGWTALHDDQHSAGELALAAAFYAANAFASSNSSVVLYGWPWHPTWYKKTTPRRDLEKAGALIQAEIERLDRAALCQPVQEGGKA